MLHLPVEATTCLTVEDSLTFVTLVRVRSITINYDHCCLLKPRVVKPTGSMCQVMSVPKINLFSIRKQTFDLCNTLHRIHLLIFVPPISIGDGDSINVLYHIQQLTDIRIFFDSGHTFCFQIKIYLPVFDDTDRSVV